MKIAILSDIHFGIRLDSQILLHHFFKFFHHIFLPYLEKEDIKTILITGDLFDRRKYINIHTAFQINHQFWVSLSGKTILALAGNHDVYHTNSLKVNSLQAITPTFLEMDYRIFIEPKEIVLGGVLCLVLPWICSDNEQECIKAIENTKAQICFAHLHLKGFELHKGVLAHDGLDASLFKKFDMVLTGHFHHKQTQENIHYLGAPYQMTWDDWNDPRGFHIFDTTTRKLEFVPNPFEIFHKVEYDDSQATSLGDVFSAINLAPFKDCYVKILVKNRTNPFFFDKFVEQMEKVAVDVKVVESKIFDLENNSPLGELNTLSVLKTTLREADLNFDKNKLENFLVNLYHQARKMEA